MISERTLALVLGRLEAWEGVGQSRTGQDQIVVERTAYGDKSRSRETSEETLNLGEDDQSLGQVASGQILYIYFELFFVFCGFSFGGGAARN